MHVRTIFALVAITAGVIVSGLFALYLVSAASSSDHVLYDSDLVGAGAAVLGLIFGVIGTFAGAIASIQIAALGLKNAVTQERRAATEFLEVRFARASELYSQLSVAVSQIYAAGIAVFLALPKDTNFEEAHSQKIPDDLVREYALFAAALGDLSEALKRLATDQFAFSGFALSIAGKPRVLEGLTESLVRLGEERLGVTVSIESPVDLTHLLMVARSRFEEQTLAPAIEARAFSIFTTNQPFHTPYSNANVTMLMFTGYMIFSLLKKVHGETVVANFGAAIIHDLVSFLPNTHVIKSALKSDYPHIAEHVDNLYSTYDPSKITSHSLQSALRETDAIGGLYLLRSG